MNQPATKLRTKNRSDRDAFLLGIRAERVEESFTVCEEHGDGIEACTRDCRDSQYEVMRASDRLEDAISDLPERLRAIADGARIGARKHAALLRHRRTLGEHREIMAASHAKAVRAMIAKHDLAYGPGTRHMARFTIDQNKQRIAAQIAKAEQWLHELVLGGKP